MPSWKDLKRFCEHDGWELYTFENCCCKEEPDLPLGDETIKVANTKGSRGEICSELREALHYLDGGQITGAYSKELVDAVKSVKSSEESRLEYMLLWVRDNEMRAEGRAEGIAEGRAEGIAEGRAEGHAEGRAEGLMEGAVTEAVNIYRNELHMSDEEIADIIMSRFELDRERAEIFLHKK